MKALTLTQPWATLVMLGEKRIETRPVLFKHRGRLAIHASRQLDDVYRDNPVFVEALARHGIHGADQFPLGCVLGVVEVIDGHRFTEGPFPSCVPLSWRDYMAPDEQHFGDYRPGRGGLLLRNADPFPCPIEARGMNGLWNWDGLVEARS